jgi:hypothetical protein
VWIIQVSFPASTTIFFVSFRWGQEKIAVEKVLLFLNRCKLFSIIGLDKKLKAIVKYVSGNVSDNGIIQNINLLSIGFQTVLSLRKPLLLGKL